MEIQIKYLQLVFISNFFKLLWKNAANRILVVADIFGLITSLFPTVTIPPLLFLVINIMVVLGTSIYLLIKRKYRVMSKPKLILLEHTYHINALAISKDDKYLISCGGDDYAILWDLKSKKILLRLPHKSWVANVAFSPDSNFFYTLMGNNGTIGEWEIKTGKLIFIKTWHRDQTRGFAISKSGKRAVICCKDGSFSYFDPTDEHFVSMPIKIPDRELRKVCFSKSDIIALATAKGEIFIVDFGSNGSFQMIYQDKNKEMIRDIVFNTKGTILAFTDSGGFLKVLNLLNNKVYSVKAHNGHAITVAFSPNDQFIATGGQDNIICIWDLEKDNIIKSFEIHCHTDYVTSLVFDHNMRLYSSSRDNRIMIWNLSGLY